MTKVTQLSGQLAHINLFLLSEYIFIYAVPIVKS